MDLEYIKQKRDGWRHCDAFNARWYDYIKIDMVDYLISEIERLKKEIEDIRDSAFSTMERSKSSAIRAIYYRAQQALKEKK